MTSRVLAVDAGKTGCRAAWFVDGHRQAAVEVRGGPLLADVGGAAAVQAAVLAVVRATGAGPDHTGDPTATAVGIGLAGASRHPEAARVVAAAVRDLLDTDRVVVASDVIAAHAGALDGGPGVVAAAGTGAVALAIAAGGEARTADGWGPVLGDEGSGHAIGRAGLVAALRAHDGRPGGSSSLRALATRRYGPLDDVVAAVHGTPNVARTVAAFAPDVLTAADEGDDAAVAIVATAARGMADAVAAASRLLRPPADGVAVSWAGSLFRAEARYAAPFRAHLTAGLPGARVRPPAGDALDGAHHLATARDGLHTGLVQVV